MTTNQAAVRAAELTLTAFNAFDANFRMMTRRAKRRFEEKDWWGGRRDAAERLDLYDKVLDQAASTLDTDLGKWAREQPVWVAAKQLYATLVTERFDIDRAETFFNSVTRRMLMTVGINREVEFFYLHPKVAAWQQEGAVHRSYTNTLDTRSVVRTILNDVPFEVRYENIDRDAGLVAQEIDLYLWPIVGVEKTYRIDIVNAIFYRNKGAYLVGRIVVDARTIPLVIPLINGESGIYIDTVLLHESEVGIVFSFAYSYFFVDIERYDALIEFLRSIIPHTEMAELYTALGYNRHGKTEFYREPASILADVPATRAMTGGPDDTLGGIALVSVPQGSPPKFSASGLDSGYIIFGTATLRTVQFK